MRCKLTILSFLSDTNLSKTCKMKANIAPDPGGGIVYKVKLLLKLLIIGSDQRTLKENNLKKNQFIENKNTVVLIIKRIIRNVKTGT